MSVAARTASAATIKSQFSKARMTKKDYQQLTVELGLVDGDKIALNGQSSIILEQLEEDEIQDQNAIALTDSKGVKRKIDYS